MSIGDRFRDDRQRPARHDEGDRAHRQRDRQEHRLADERQGGGVRRQEERRAHDRRQGPEDLQPIWFRLREPRGRGRSALSYEQIVDAAIALADAEGPKAITMRKIAQALDVGTMSLYWYVPSKDDLIELMVDQVYGEDEAPAPTGDWRDDLAAIARARRKTILRHPWMLTFAGMGPPRGPNALRAVERVLALLDGLDLPIELAVRIGMTVDTFVTGAVLREQLEEEERRSWAAPGEPEDLGAYYLGLLEASGEYPHVVALMRSGVDPDDPATRDERFEFGLACLLDGIAARVARRGP